ncbi:MAG: hypothetical protein HY303_19210 [Candidatus Wallbacteria bacterium]|nr:hypothetical protein [Candidatus Wallbacteria bacterium]
MLYVSDEIVGAVGAPPVMVTGPVGHLAPLEAPEPVNANCRRFLAEHGL